MARRVVSIRFSDDELAEVDRRAEAAGLDRTAWIRRCLLGRLVDDDGRHPGAGERWRLRAGDRVRYMHPDWGSIVGEVLRVDGNPGKILVQDQRTDGAREWWPRADCVRVDDP